MTRREGLIAGGGLLFRYAGRAQDAAVPPNRAKRQGRLLLHARSRTDAGEVQQRELVYNVAETAIIICDMWDNHYCQNSAKRVGPLAVRMNGVVGAARQNGVQIIHAPSGTMDVYAGTPYRLRMLRAPKVTPPVPIASSCPLDQAHEGALPIDDVTQPCDDQVVGPAVRRYNRENELLEIKGYDGISDSGKEI